MSASITIYEVSGGDGTIINGSSVQAYWAGNGAVYGGGAYIAVGRDETGLQYQAYKRFDISSLAGKTILSASFNWHYGYKETDSGGPPNAILFNVDDYGTLTTADWNWHQTHQRKNYGVVLTNATGIGWQSKDIKTELQTAATAEETYFAFEWDIALGNEDWYALGHSSTAYKAYLSVTYCSAPASPTPASAQIIDAENIRIDWTDNSSGETQETEFRIERSVDGGAYSLLTTKNPDEIEYIDNSVAAGHTYKYRIRASNQAGDSDWVETDTISPVAGGMQGYMNC